MSLISISSFALYTAFVLYLIATFFFGATIKDKQKDHKKGVAGTIGITLTIIGFLAQLTYSILRWVAGGHAPVSNLFEFMTFFGMTLVFAFIIIYFIYKLSALGLFALPTAMIIIAYASMFPTEIAPLVPSLQSHWLYIHVTTVSLAQGILTISFVAGVMYLIRQIDQTVRTKHTTWLEIVMYTLVLFVGFIIITTTFNAMDYKAEFQNAENVTVVEYHLPAIAGPQDGVLVTEDAMAQIGRAHV